MGLMVALMRILPLCAVLLALTLLVPIKAFAYGEKLAVSPLWGPLGRTVIAIGTGWHDQGRLGWVIPIGIGTSELAAGYPNANGEFTVSLTLPLNPPPGEIFNGRLRISAATGSGGSAFAFYTISNTPLPNCFDAYFIGVHGTAEGPDSHGEGQSQVINETWTAFKALADQHNKPVDYSLLHYDTPPIESLVDQALYATRVFPAVQQGVQELTNVIKGPNGILYGVLEKCPTQSIVLAGYSFGAWVVNDWLSRAENKDLWPNVIAVELYGDPLWERTGPPYLGGTVDTYKGVARVINPTGVGFPNPNPYSNTPEGPGVGISDRWQSRCLKDDPICGEGYGQNLWLAQLDVAKDCGSQFCTHKMYTKANGGHNLTERGAKFLALKAFPDVFTTGKPSVAHYETFVEGDFVYIRLYYTGSSTGFGFVGANGYGWGFEEHLFSKAPYWTRVSPNDDRVDYPFNHLCSTQPGNQSDIDAWVYSNTQGGIPVRIHLACSAPKEVITPFFDQ